MIVITCTDKEITVKGHANDAEHPRNEETVQACASVTALVQTLIASVHEIGGDNPEIELKKGYFLMNKTHLSDVSMHLIDAFIIGINLLKTGYPDCIEY